MPAFYSMDTPEETARLLRVWPDAETLEPELAAMLLDVAAEQVLEYGVQLAEGADIPSRFLFAQIRQAQVLWASGLARGDGDLGTDAYSFMPRPLDKTIRGIIRPTRGTADVL